MISFLQFLVEEMSKREVERRLRKNIDGGKEPVQDPSMPVIHHDPHDRVTAYKMTGAESCGKAGASGWCTTPASSIFRDSYLRNGTLSVIHAGKHAYQAFIPHKGSKMKPEFKNADNQDVNYAKIRSAHPSISKIPGLADHFAIGKYDKGKFASASKENMVGTIKSLPDMHERLRHLKGITDTTDSGELHNLAVGRQYTKNYVKTFGKGPKLKAEDYESVAGHLDSHDLHHFADDEAPEIRHHVVVNSPPHLIPHELTHDPDPLVRSVAQERTKGLQLKPMERPAEKPPKEQKAFSFMKPTKAPAKKKIIEPPQGSLG